MKLNYKVRRARGAFSVVREYTDARGRFHRPEEDGPAVERADGTKFWYIKGKLHRENGPAIEYGPAIMRVAGDKFWYIKGKLHRENGPAVEYANGEKEWWLNGHRYTEAEFTASCNPRQALREAWCSSPVGQNKS